MLLRNSQVVNPQTAVPTLASIGSLPAMNQTRAPADPSLHHATTAIGPSQLSEQTEILEDAGRGSRPPKRYAKGRLLGKGGFAKCYEATDLESNQVYAVKVVAKASLTKQRAKAKLITEIQIHRTLDHPRVVKYYHHFDDSEHVFMLLELCPNQSLNELLRRKKRFTEAEAAFYLSQLVDGLIYLKRHRVIHRDLKLGNLFLGANMELKIGDFGLAAKLDFDLQKRTTICGTPNYIAPEILESSSSSSVPGQRESGHSYPVDVWSVGVILYTMLVGKPPFEDVDVKATYQRIRENRYSFPESVYISQSGKQLITALLRADPRNRPSLEDILSSHFLQTHSRVTSSVTRLDVAGMPSSISGYNRVNGMRESQAILGISGGVTPRRNDSGDYARIDSPMAREEVVPGWASSQPTPWSSSVSARKPVAMPLRASLAADMRSSVGEGFSARSSANFPSRPPILLGSSPRGIVTGSWTGALPTLRAAASPAFASSPPPTVLRGDHFNIIPSTVTRSHTPPLAAASSEPVNSQQLRGLSGRPVGWIENAAPEIYLTKWIDYSSKYGIGYLLSNGWLGVYYNDASRMVVDGKSWSKVWYITRPKGGKVDTWEIIDLNDEGGTPDVKKKIILIKNFRNYLSVFSDKEGTTRGISGFGGQTGHDDKVRFERDSPPLTVDGVPVHLKKWLRTKHAIIFQISSRTWQVIFNDGYEVIMSAKTQSCTFLERGQLLTSYRTYSLDTIADVPEEYISKRLTYTKNAVLQMLGGPTPGLLGG